MEWPKADTVERDGDMAPRGDMVLRVDKQDDGDVVVTVMEKSRSGELLMASCEFCTVGMGGGRSTHTRQALFALMVAMEKDNAECPLR